MIAGMFAVDSVGGMGWKGSMPWPNNPDDMKWFKATTQNQIVVMGRKTWDSPDMPSPLPGRHNVVFTNNFFDQDDIEQIRGDVCEALVSLKSHNKRKNVFVIGGANLLMQSRPVLERVYLTRISGGYLNDTTIDIVDFLDGMVLHQTVNLGSCIVEEYHNEAISSSVKAYTNKRKKQDR
jgi:dihydrofolate reductase